MAVVTTSGTVPAQTVERLQALLADVQRVRQRSHGYVYPKSVSGCNLCQMLALQWYLARPTGLKRS